METQYSYQLETKFDQPSKAGEFEGFAATYGNVDLTGDVIVPGAFSETLGEHKAAGTQPALLWHHKQDQPIGRWDTIREADDGLAVKGRLSIKTDRGRDAHELMKDGALSLSIGYQATKSGHDTQGNRLLKSVRLIEISAVALPANTQAKITSVKSITDIRTFEDVLRSEHGFSRRQARRVAQKGWRALDANEDINALTDLIRASTNRIRNY